MPLPRRHAGLVPSLPDAINTGKGGLLRMRSAAPPWIGFNGGEGKGDPGRGPTREPMRRSETNGRRVVEVAFRRGRSVTFDRIDATDGDMRPLIDRRFKCTPVAARCLRACGCS